jgi:hypothetical protein
VNKSKVVPIRHRENLKLEHDVPLPRRSKYPYPFADMAIGDSFLCHPENVVLFRAAVSNAHRKLGYKFITRMLPEGMRCWRIK